MNLYEIQTLQFKLKDVQIDVKKTKAEEIKAEEDKVKEDEQFNELVNVQKQYYPSRFKDINSQIKELITVKYKKKLKYCIENFKPLIIQKIIEDKNYNYNKLQTFCMSELIDSEIDTDIFDNIEECSDFQIKRLSYLSVINENREACNRLNDMNSSLEKFASSNVSTNNFDELLNSDDEETKNDSEEESDEELVVEQKTTKSKNKKNNKKNVAQKTIVNITNKSAEEQKVVQ